MVLIWRQTGTTLGSWHAIALFGVGLIGGALLRAVMRRGVTSLVDLPLNWSDGAQRALDLEALTEAICSSDRSGRLRRIDVVWAAGKAGFGAGSEQLASENLALKDVAAWARRLSLTLSEDTVTAFHMMSSAGGLFEGLRFVERSTPPHPVRAYGEAKLIQEETVERLRSDMVAHIYRPSSVYGFGRAGTRAGLVNTLIANAKGHAVSRIFGGLDTVRDYVLVDDIGEFLATMTMRPPGGSSTFILASGKPTSVSEIARIMCKVLGRPLYLKLDMRPSNASHITFRKSALPKGWRPTDLETGIRLVARQHSESWGLGVSRYRFEPPARSQGE